MHISNPAQSRDISLSLRHTVMLWMSVEMWRLMTVDDNCLPGQRWHCGDSRVSGGEGGLPDCDVVMLVVDVPDKHNVRARKVGFWERITSEKGWRGWFWGGATWSSRVWRLSLPRRGRICTEEPRRLLPPRPSPSLAPHWQPLQDESKNRNITLHTFLQQKVSNVNERRLIISKLIHFTSIPNGL